MAKPLGKLGERQAVHFLASRGYKILATNFFTRWGELDIVACDAQGVVFIEVKTRSDADFGVPAEAVNSKKLKKMLLAAQEFRRVYELGDAPFRFEVVAILKGQPPELIADVDIDRTEFFG